MAVIFEKTYGKTNKSDLVSGVVVAKEGLRLIDHVDTVGPEHTNRPMENLLTNDQEINYHLNELTSLFNDGVFEDFGDKFAIVVNGDITGNSVGFIVKSGLGKIGNNALHLIYRPETTYQWDYDTETKKTVKVEVAPDVTELSIDVTSIGINQYRRDLVVLDNTGEVTVINGTAQTLLPTQYSQIDAPDSSIALYSILFRKISGVLQQPVIEAVYDVVEIEGVDLVSKFTDLFGNGIFLNEPTGVSDPLNIEFNPELTGGNIYRIGAGWALINGKLVKYGESGNSIALSKSMYDVGTGDTPGAAQGSNTNGWELVDFTSATVGAAGTGNGNTQYLVFDGVGKTGYIDSSTVKIFTAAAVGEGGFTLERTFDTNILTAPGLEEYSIDVTTGTIRREKTTAPLQVYIKYRYYRNRRYLPYLDENGDVDKLQSTDDYPDVPAEFSSTDLPTDTIGLKSIVYNAIDGSLQEDSFGDDFRIFMKFQLEDGQMTTASIQDGAITNDKLADDAVGSSAKIADGVIIQEHLSEALKLSLSSSRMYSRGSLVFRKGSDNIYTFVDNVDGAGNVLTKQLIDLAGVSLSYIDAELQVTADRPVVIKSVIRDSATTEVTVNPQDATNKITVQPSDVGNIFSAGDTITVDALALSFSDFGFSQAGDAIVYIFDTETDLEIGQSRKSLSTIKTTIASSANAFYKFTLTSPVSITIGKEYEIRIVKTIPTDTLYVHTATEGAGRSANIAYKAYYKPTAGKYGRIGNRVQGYILSDEYGDLTVPSSERSLYGKPSYYIPYAANISDVTSFTVFENVDSDVSNYIAVDVTKGVFKFKSGSEPTSSKIYADYNIDQGMNEISSARIHRYNGETVEHALRVLETELGAVRANISNNLELMYSLGNGKFRFSSEDRQLTDLTGDPLKISDGNLSDPIHVIDTLYTVLEGKEYEREIQDSYNDTDYVQFVTRSDNVAILALNITDVGTDYTAIEIAFHNGAHTAGSYSNPPVQTATIARSAINLGLNFFRLETNITIGETYHFYVKVIGFAGGLAQRPKIRVDVENGNIEYYHYFMPVAGKYGTVDGFTIFDQYGDLNLGSESRGEEIDFSQENFLDDDGHQVQPHFDDNDLNPENANTTFPIFSPSNPAATGMIRFDIYFRYVPQVGEDGYNGVFRLMLHDLNNNPIVPSNALPGQNYIDVRIPKQTGWMQIPFVASLAFGESYHMHIWGNLFDLKLYVGTHPVTQQKAFRYIAGDRFIVFATDLSGNNFDTYQIVDEKLVAADVINGRIKFHTDAIQSGNKYYANFNIFTQVSQIQSDTIQRPNNETIENALVNFVSVRDSDPTRVGIDKYTFNERDIQLIDELGRELVRSDGELPNPYERLSIGDVDVGGTPATLTTNEDNNTYTFFINHHEAVSVSAMQLHFNTIAKSSYDVIANIYRTDTGTKVKQAYIRARDMIAGFNRFPLEDVSGVPLNFTAEPNVQYAVKYSVNVTGGGTAPKLSQNTNGIITTSVYIKPDNGLYGGNNGVVISDDYGDIYRYNYQRDEKEVPSIVMNTDSGLVDLHIAKGDTRCVAVWEENNTIRGMRFDLTTGSQIDTAKIEIAGGSGYIVTQPDVAVADNIAYVVWNQSGRVHSRRLFINNSDPMSVDTASYMIDNDATDIVNPSVGAGSDRVIIAWEDTRHSPQSGVVPGSDQNDMNIFAKSFDNATSSSQFVPADNTNGDVMRINTVDLNSSSVGKPEISVWRDNAVIVYESDINNPGLSNDVMLSVIDMDANTLVRSDIRVDKAPLTVVDLQHDASTPKIIGWRDRHLIAWMDNRNSSTYHIYGKVYNSNDLTFEQSDIQMEMETQSGIVHFNIDANEKIAAIGYSDGSNGIVKRYDFASMTAHDNYFGWDFDLSSTIPNSINEIYPVVNDKIINSFAMSSSINFIAKSRLTGINIEPISMDLTDFDTDVPEGYIGIDVKKARFKFSDGYEV